MEGVREDRSGDALAAHLAAHGFDVVERITTADGTDAVADTLRAACAGFAGLVVTTGGTGFGPRDLTPEGTRRGARTRGTRPGGGHAAPSARWGGSLAMAGTVGEALVLNTPGSTTGCIETLDAVLDVVPHALDLLAGGRPH